ncbi:MAG TPA: hypothetical protein VEM57_08970 [Candidatus Binatus sp.]|nr:hypothetical protein [Candidatus Binatus sp.]
MRSSIAISLLSLAIFDEGDVSTLLNDAVLGALGRLGCRRM